MIQAHLLRYCATRSPANTWKALWCIRICPSLPFKTHASWVYTKPLFGLLRHLGFSELKTPLVYPCAPPKKGQDERPRVKKSQKIVKTKFRHPHLYGPIKQWNKNCFATFDFLSPRFFFVRGCFVEYFDFCYLDLGNSFVLAVIAIPIWLNSIHKVWGGRNVAWIGFSILYFKYFWRFLCGTRFTIWGTKMVRCM